jgi:histidinol phosphatase-like PHP family hydrolase
MRSEIAAVKSGHADVLGHPMYVLSAGKYLKSMNDIPNGLLAELAQTAAKHDVALEINGHFYRDLTPPAGYFDLFKICLENGVKLSTGSDAHRPLYVGDLSKIHTTLTQLKAKPSDIYTPVE